MQLTQEPDTSGIAKHRTCSTLASPAIACLVVLACSEADLTSLPSVGVGAPGASGGAGTPMIPGARPSYAGSRTSAENPSNRPPEQDPPRDAPDAGVASPAADAGVDAGPALGVAPALALLSELPKELELSVGPWSTRPAFSALTFDDPVAMEQAPRSRLLFVCEREGRVYAFENVQSVKRKQLVLDITTVTQGEGDSGLLGIAFHPQFGAPGSSNRPYAYLHYAYTQFPDRERPGDDKPTWSRLSRFTVDVKTGTFDRASELVLIDQFDESPPHQGGAMFFRPTDGFLYLALGDEGPTHCRLGNCQRIDRDLFSGVLRIDVDMLGGDVSHPIVRQPESGETANYFIPNDNPFVGRAGSLEEFYAIGLRSPHKMTYDAVDDIGWIADVGEGDREEVDTLGYAANYQWPMIEGFRPLPFPMPDPIMGIWTPPVLDIGHDLAYAIIGGYVYRGTQLPELRGKYVFADYSSGRVWAFSYAPKAGGADLLDQHLLTQTPFNAATGGISSFAVDAAGELYFLTIGEATKIQQLVASTPSTNLPLLLTQRFDEVVTALANNPAAVEYEVQSPLWSDGAHKQRWAVLPPNGKIGFASEGPWSFPEGTIFVKNFTITLDERVPTHEVPIETRFLVIGDSGRHYGVSYEWDDDGVQAHAVLQRQVKDLWISQADGNVRTQAYELPGPRDCIGCHNPQAGAVLGVRTEQMNRMHLDTRTGASANQLATWATSCMFSDQTTPGDPALYPALAAFDDPERSVEERLRSYWAGNCSMCHGTVSSIRSRWDARYTTPLEGQGVIFGSLAADSGGDKGLFVVSPGQPEDSGMYLRSSVNTSLRMPPLGRMRADEQYLDLLRQWIVELDPPAP
jgi:glucose/arabinose dehydrogenase